MRDEDDGLVGRFELFEIVGAFLLEGGIADGEDFVEEKNVAVGANGDGKSEANLHAGGVVFEFLVLKIFEFGEIPDVVIHGFHFVVTEAEQSAIHVDVFATGELGVETDAELDEGNKGAVDGDVALFGVVDTGEDFEESGFAGTVTTDNADEFAFFDGEIETAEDLLFTVTFDAAEAIKDGLFQTG